MTSHVDTGRAPALSEQGKKNHLKIFGPPKGAKKRTPEEEEAYDISRKNYHAKLAEDGKKDAQWYLDNERRVPQNPDYQKKPEVTEAYREGWDRVFGSGE